MSRCTIFSRVRVVFHHARMRLSIRSRSFVRIIHARMESLILLWMLLFGVAAALRIGSTFESIRTGADLTRMLLSYGLIALAPIAGYRLAMAAFPGNLLPERPCVRLAVFGRWRQLHPLRARAHPAFGPFGFMASLLAGLLINILVRSFEFLLAVPAVSSHAPLWATTIFQVMAFDTIAMNFLYAVCFVLALRSIPLFPRTLLLTWALDIVLQVSIAYQAAAAPDLPASVAYSLREMLSSNVTKVFISMAIWTPYLLLSQRVNVTYRSRVAAA